MDEKRTNGNLALEQQAPRVIIIEPSEPEVRKLRVAAYARVSSASDEQENSFAAQVSYYTTHITGNDAWELVDIYADEAVTGTSTQKRDDFKRLMADCRRGLVDKILTKSIARFARNSTEFLTAIRELKALGVSVVFEEQGIDTLRMSGEMMAAIFAAKAQEESQTISKNVRWGCRHRMQRGTYLPSSIPYGYVLKDKSICINEAQAGIVRRIFNEYLAGASIAQIASSLQGDKIPTKTAEKWHFSSVRYILSNERYIGDSLWQKSYASDTFPYTQVRNRGERDQYYVENTHPAIITKEVFAAAQSLLAKRGEKIVTAGQETPHPLQQKIRCGACGASFRRKVHLQKTYWVCRTHFTGKDSCPITQIPELEIYDAFLRLFYNLKHDGYPVLQTMLSQLQAVRERQMLWSVEIVALNEKICYLSNQNRLLAELKKHGNSIDSDFFISQSNLLARQLRDTKLEKERLLEAQADDTIAKTKELLEVLDDAPDFLYEFDPLWFDALVDKITVESNDRLLFHLINGVEVRESMERVVR